MGRILLSLLLSLLLTLAVELLLALALKLRGRDLLIVALVNLLTNPIVNYCYDATVMLFANRSLVTLPILVVLEAAAVIAEFLFYRKLLREEHIGKLKLSLLLNGASFAAGLVVSGVLRLVG